MDVRARNDDPVSVVLVEGDPLTREGIVAILGRHADIAIVGVAEDTRDALQRVSQSDVDVVLVDARLGDDDSHALVHGILDSRPESRVIVMNVASDPEDVIRFIRRGASGFVMKDANIDTFVGAIRSVSRGGRVLPDGLTGTLFSHIATTTRARGGSDGDDTITAREREVIDLVAEGASNKQISRELGISVHTVKSHMRNILEKLSLHSRLEVATYAYRMGGGTGTTDRRRKAWSTRRSGAASRTRT